jgi:putative restriction endonuclease
MGIVDEFARYRATLKNRFYCVSAISDGQMVASLWQHRIKVEDGKWVYRDCLSRWSGQGNTLFREHLKQAIAEDLPVRIVMARTDNIPLIEHGGDGSKAKNTFKARPEWIGKVAEFDGDNFVIQFEKHG